MIRLKILLWSLSGLLIWATPGLSTESTIPKLEQEASFSIEKAPVELALIQFSRQADIQILLAPDSAANVTASAVHGRFVAGEALAALLKGTGLTYTIIGNTVTVQLPVSKEAIDPIRRTKATEIQKYGHNGVYR